MGIWADFWRGACAVSDQQKFDKLCRRMAKGEDVEHQARALAMKLGVRPEKKR